MSVDVDHREAADFVARLARALHQFGSPSHRLEQAMAEVAASLGLESSFFATPTAIFASFSSAAGPYTRLERVQPGGHELEKLVRLDQIAAQVARGQLGVPEATLMVDAVVAAPPRFGGLLTVVAFAVASAGAAVFFGGNAVDLGVSAMAGAIMGVLSLLAGRAAALRDTYDAVAALTVSAFAAVAAARVGASPYIVTVSGLIVLVPGLTLTLAMAELASRHLAAGTARLTGAITVFMLIGFGVALGSRLSLLLPAAPPPDFPLPPFALELSVLAVGAALAVLFHAHPKDTGWIIAAGALGFYGARAGAMVFGPELGTFVGGLVVGLAGNTYARVFHKPSAVATVPGIMLLVPGSIGFRSIMALVEDNVISGIDTAFAAILVASALATGLLVANMLLPSRRAL